MSLLRKFVDLLYPPRCPICRAFLCEEDRQDGSPEGFCGNCLGGFSKLGPPLCPICGDPFRTGIEEDHLCEECLRRRPFFDKILAPYLYEGRIMDAVHQFKYQGKTHMAKALGPILASFGQKRMSEEREWIVMPVPLHRKKLRERGFNQSLLLARQVAPRLGAVLDYSSLCRTRDTQAQMELRKQERRKNVRRAFECIDPKAVKGKAVLLIDDVATTGSTLNECARVLKRAGCRKVLCLVVARAG
jgi:ComF family protein